MTAIHSKPVAYHNLDEIIAIVHGFQNRTLSREAWTHRAHLTVALWYLLHHSLPDATRLVREGIKSFNAAHGIVTTPTGGYHETLTLFWICVVNSQLEEVTHGKFSLVAVFNELLARCDNKNLPLEFYSRERLWSIEARANWMGPDLKRLSEPPAVAGGCSPAANSKASISQEHNVVAT